MLLKIKYLQGVLVPICTFLVPVCTFLVPVCYILGTSMYTLVPVCTYPLVPVCTPWYQFVHLSNLQRYCTSKHKNKIKNKNEQKKG